MKLLLVEDNQTDARLIQELLKDGPAGRPQLTLATRLDAAVEQLRQESFDLVLLDFGLPDSQGMETLTRIQRVAENMPVVALTGLDDRGFAWEVLRSGAQDYLVKGQFNAELLTRTIHYAIERKRAEREVRRLNAELRAANEMLEHRVAARTAELAAANTALHASKSLALDEARHADIARQQAEQAEAALRESHRLLEERVRDRTVALSETNHALEAEMTQRKQVLRKLHDAEETERGRISRELHDRLGQDLTALKLGLNWLQKQCPFATAHNPAAPPTPPEPAAEKLLDQLPTGTQCPFAAGVQSGIFKLEGLTDGLMREVHRLAWELHPAVLDDLGLEAALRRYVAEWSKHGTVVVDFHCHGLDTGQLPLELSTALYRVTQEALTNVLRHARAHCVSVLLDRRPRQLSLIVEDDGVGFDATEILQAPGTRHKLGLLGMEERIRLAGGTLEIESSVGHGTTVFVRIPLETAPAN